MNVLAVCTHLAWCRAHSRPGLNSEIPVPILLMYITIWPKRSYGMRNP